jgi:hypothetical protein
VALKYLLHQLYQPLFGKKKRRAAIFQNDLYFNQYDE